MPLILEGLVTTRDADGGVHVAPMGPVAEASMATLLLRPFRTSTTYANLARTRYGVFHVVDDVLLLAQAAIGRLEAVPETFPAVKVDGAVLADACRWYEFAVDDIDDSRERTEMPAHVVHVGRIRDFFGFNRARHAVVEAAILATRVHLLPRDDILNQLAALQPAVEKTGGPRERQAFELLRDCVLEGARS
jgi:hypothetical protein